MSDDRLILTRQELYELAWSKPMSDLARDFGISDVALAKRCRNLHIPVPGRGYWARVAAGQTPRRPVLPEHEPTWRDQRALTVQPSAADLPDGQSENVGPDAVVTETRARLDHLSIIFSEDLLATTAAVRRTAVAHRHPRRGDLSFARGEKSGAILELRVSATVLDRALLFADTLLRASMSLGWSFVGPASKGNGSGSLPSEAEGRGSATTTSPDIGALLVLGERVAFRLEERMKEELGPPRAAERVRERRMDVDPGSRVHLQPTGALRLVRIDRSSWSERRRTWYDRRGRRLEEQISEILRGFFELAIEVKAHRIEDERRRRQWEEEERQRRELEERQEANAKLVKALELQAGAWHRARFLRAYVRAARRAVPNGLTAQFLGNRIDFLQWAEEYVDRLDPLHERPRAEDMLPEAQSWPGSSELKEELSRLFGHDWANSWKYGPMPEAREIDGDDLE